MVPRAITRSAYTFFATSCLDNLVVEQNDTLTVIVLCRMVAAHLYDVLENLVDNVSEPKAVASPHDV